MEQPQETRLAAAGVLAEQMADKIRRLVISRYSPGEKLPTEQQLARQFRRSRFTVRKALAILAQQGVVRRQRGSGTYVGDRLPGRKGTTGLVYFGGAASLLRYPFTREVYAGLLEGLADEDRHLHVITNVRGDVSLVTEISDRLDLGRLDSVICFDIFSPQVLAALAERMVTVSVDYQCQQPGVSSCWLDHERNVELAVNHLWLLGHRRMALAGGRPGPSVDPAIPARRTGFTKALAARAIAPHGDEICPVTSARHAVQLMRRWVALPPEQRPTAFVCMQGHWPIAQAAVELGVEIPRQLSLVSVSKPDAWLYYWDLGLSLTDPEHDDVHWVLESKGVTDPLAAAYAPLRNMVFTSVELPFRQMGRWAMREVYRRVGRSGLTPSHEVFSATLIPGNTVAPPPG